MPFQPWDWALIVAVAAHSAVVAYLHHPRLKALMLNLPIPFTLATLSVGARVDATNAAGLLVLLGFSVAVWALHKKLRVPIVPAILAAWVGYIVVGGLLAEALRGRGDATFWCAMGLSLAVGAALHVTLPHREEPGYRSPLPVFVKVPIILMVVIVLVLLKRWLGGFMTIAPMVGVIASYEARNSLWRIVRQIPIVMLTCGPMMVVVRYAEPPLGIAAALALGWCAMLALLIPLTLHQWRGDAKGAP